MEIILPQQIDDDSWLHEERFKWFLEGYRYATTQTRAIPALVKVSPEELYFAVSAIIRGSKRAGAAIPNCGDTAAGAGVICGDLSSKPRGDLNEEFNSP